MTSQLTIYNGALLLLSQPELTAVDEDKEARHVLDHWYEDKDGVKACLEMGNWNFATRSVEIDYNTSVTPDFGLKRAFTRPTDWVRTTEVSSDEFFTHPMTDLEFKDEQSYFFADIDKLYMRYVSDDTSYGKDLSLWPESFNLMVEAWFAWRISPRVNPKQLTTIKKYFEDERKNARSKDALQEGIKFFPTTSWQRARRRGSSGGGRDLGSRGNLTG